ncbi:MAG TPA: hypothetical protein PLB01_03640 [Thermoanaerobaculia bacterium]|nr:hypothetical protein [Thermoanaerobaculia bacterium]
MRARSVAFSAVAFAGLLAGADLLACGDKFLVVGRGTRYQRPKGARAASVLFYASAESGLSAMLKAMPVDSVLKREGHRGTSVTTPEQLSAALAGGHFDVIFADAADASTVERLLAGRADAPTLLPFCDGTKSTSVVVDQKGAFCVTTPPKERSMLEAIDQAVERRDRRVAKPAIRS